MHRVRALKLSRATGCCGGRARAPGATDGRARRSRAGRGAATRAALAEALLALHRRASRRHADADRRDRWQAAEAIARRSVIAVNRAGRLRKLQAAFVEGRRTLKLVFRAVERQPILAVARHHPQIGEGDFDILLADTEKAADADDRRFEMAVLLDDQIGEITDLLLVRIVDALVIDVGCEPLRRR